MKPEAIIRCAVYTRKSSEDGLEQSFNSLHAQREACEAYIKSQQSEGWKVMPEEYNDGGFSGGTMVRPGLNRLLEKIHASQIDVVVVYKVDRLSRSLADFVRMVETFEKHGVSFVSVTQHFNTSTSMGRLTLNVLLSFAQFEREVTGERIRDKITASKKKGMWMGGPTPLGYDVIDKILVVNPKEAKVVKLIYEQYHRLGSVRALKTLLDEKGIKSKCRTSRAGNPSGGASLSRGALYTLLKNPVYVGKVKHKEKHYAGPHAPIIDLKLWEHVQAQLNDHQQQCGPRAATKDPSLLTGLLWDDRGYAMSPTFTRKGQRRYRYYVSQALLQFKDKDAGSIKRIPALEIETPILNKIENLFSSATEVLALIPEQLSPKQMADLTKPLEQLRHDLRSPSPQPKIILLKTLIKKIAVGRQAITITLAMAGLWKLLGITPENTDSASTDEAEQNDTKTWVLPLSLRRYGREVKVMLGDRLTPIPQPHSMLVQGLQRALKKALIWNDGLLSGKTASLAKIAQQENVTQRYIAQMIRLAYLAPDIQEAIIKGKIPPTWTVDQFRESIPLDWEHQRLKFNLRHTG